MVINGTDQLRFPESLSRREEILSVRSKVLLCDLPEHIAQRETKRLKQLLGDRLSDQIIVNCHSLSPGNAVTVEVETPNISETFTVIGERGKRAELVAESAARDALNYIDSQACIGVHLADQILIPLALCGQGEFVTSRPTPHTLTNIETVQKFMDIEFKVERIEQQLWKIALH